MSAGGRAHRVPFLTLALVGACLVLQLTPELRVGLAFEREALRRGEAWRFLTGHLVHGSAALAALDLLVLGALGAWWELRSRAAWSAIVLASALLASLALLWSTELRSYSGSSALASGFFAAAAVELLRSGSRAGRALGGAALALFALKCGLELVGEPPLGLVPLPPGTAVAGEAHLAGGLAGALVAFARRAPREGHSK